MKKANPFTKKTSKAPMPPKMPMPPMPPAPPMKPPKANPFAKGEGPADKIIDMTKLTTVKKAMKAPPKKGK